MLFFILILPEALQIIGLDLNTSHVILYLGYGGNNNGTANKFKYISCYSLSILQHRDEKNVLKFKYISCYSLSAWCSAGEPYLRI